MSHEAVVPEPSPVPESAWTGRSWWKACCTGCCLGFVLLVIGFVSASYLAARWPNRHWKAFWGYPQTMMQNIQKLLAD